MMSKVKQRKKKLSKQKIKKAYLLKLLKSKFSDRIFTVKEAGKYKVSPQLFILLCKTR